MMIPLHETKICRALCEIENIQLELAGDDPYGEVLSGNLRLIVRPLLPIRGGLEKFLDGTRCPFFLFNDSHGRFDGTQFCLPVCEGESSANARGLLLEAAPGNIRGRFRRVGGFTHLNGSARGRNNFEILDDQKFWAYDSIYEGFAGRDENGSPRYFVTIV